jgi:hypothetical protein
MYFSIEKCSDKKVLQATVPITIPKTAMVTYLTSVSINPLRGRPFLK